MGERQYIRLTGTAVADAVDELDLGVTVTPRFASDEIRRGRIGGIQLGRARWTTPDDIREWIASCRFDTNAVAGALK